MAFTVITGNLGKDPELKTSQSGKDWCALSIAWSEKSKDRSGEWVDGPTVWVSARIFGKPAANAVQTLRKGMNVIAWGDLKPEAWSSDQGEQTVFAMMADGVAPTLYSQVAQVTKANQQTPQQTQAQAMWGEAAQAGQTATTGGFGNTDTPPF